LAGSAPVAGAAGPGLLLANEQIGEATFHRLWAYKNDIIHGFNINSERSELFLGGGGCMIPVHNSIVS
jgi:hypothetical protein